MFRFANPQYLWLLLAIPALVLIFWAAAARRRKRLARFGNPGVLEELMPEVSTGRTALKFILFCTAAVLLILAVARPQFGSKLREEKAQGVEMMLVVDVSNSMLAEDFEPNRLERTKYAINKLFDGLRQDRVGLIVFAGEPKVQLPITSDYRMAKAFAKRIDPSLVSVQGTAIGKALSQALLSFSGETEETHSRVIILVTDGENHEDDALAVAKRAAEMGIRIYTIGIGTPEGAPIQIGGEFIKDEKGDMVVSKLDEKMLSEVAGITGGAYVRSTKQSIGLDEIVKSINEMEQTELSMMRFEEFNEQYHTCSSQRSCCCWRSSCCSTAATRCWRTSTFSARSNRRGLRARSDGRIAEIKGGQGRKGTRMSARISRNKDGRIRGRAQR